MNKNCLTIMLEHTSESETILHDLLDLGFNGTIIAAETLKNSFLHDESSKVPNFLSVLHLTSLEESKNIMVVMILNNQQVTQVKQIINDKTICFSKIKGCMYSSVLLDYEGSF